MSHEIENNSMAWITTVPWHGLGVEMKAGASYKQWMKAAGLNWEVSRQPMFTTLPNGENMGVLGRNGNEFSVLVRDHGNKKFDQEDVFGPVGPDWVPVQNHEVFEFMDKFCKAGGMTMETCGSLKGGTEIWALAKIKYDFTIGKNDEMLGYLLFHSAHVWGKGNQVKITPVRVVCNNTLTMALGNRANTFRLPHIRAFDHEIQETATEALGLTIENLGTFKEQAEFLTKKRAPREQVEEFIAAIYQPGMLKEHLAEDMQEPLSDSFTPTSDAVMEAVLMSPGSELNTAKGTWWGAFNGVTYYEDHLRISYQDETNILGSAWFGGGARHKTKALDLAMAYAQAA